jgi:hypothetical protein
MKVVPKIFTEIEPRVTQVTIKTEFRDEFNTFLAGRKIKPEKPVQTEIWHGVESKLTEFFLPLSLPVTQSVFEDWVRSLPGVDS